MAADTTCINRQYFGESILDRGNDHSNLKAAKPSAHRGWRFFCPADDRKLVLLQRPLEVLNVSFVGVDRSFWVSAWGKFFPPTFERP